MRFFIFVILLFSHAASAQIDTRKLSTKPKEIYGDQKNIVIRLGNGGAGPTGILRELAKDYLKQSGKNYGIAWYQDISINTLQHLKNGTIDVALVYEKSQGDKAQNEGWATNYAVIFNDHFLITGPKNNPAKIDANDSVTTAFEKIATYGKKNSRKIFLSRDDNSGTNVKERSIWKALDMAPWQGQKIWYKKYHAFPADALFEADKDEAYSITDWGTWLSNKNSIKNSAIYLQGGKALLNPCFALLGKNPTKEALEFLEYLESPSAQKLIANFGKDKYGQPLFSEAAQQDFK